MRYPDPWYVVEDLSLEDFLLGMLELGKPLEVSLVGNFDAQGRGSRRDMDLPLHEDGVYSQALTEAQGGTYVDFPGIDIVGLYCLRGSPERCFTLVGDAEVELHKGQALVFDNHRVLHGRRGPVGYRVLLRIWLAQHSKVGGE